MKNWHSIILLILPLMVGVALRFTGIDHGKPDMVYHPDVAKQTMVAIRICNNNITPHRIFKDDFRRTLYPYGTSILMAKTIKTISRIRGNNDLIKVHRWNWALYMRYMATAMYMITALFAIWFLWRKTGLIPAMLAGLLLVTEPINTQYSHYAMNDVPLTAMLIATWISSALMQKEKTYIPIFSLLCGFSLGIAFNIKYQAVLAGIFPLLSWILLTKEKNWKWLLSSLISVGIGGIVGLLWTNPLLRTEPAYFFQTLPEFMHWQANIMGEDTSTITKILRNIPLLFKHLSIPGTILLLTGPIWGIYAVTFHKTDKKNNIAILSASTFCIITILIFIVSRDFVRENDLIPILAFCALITAFFLKEIIPPKIKISKQNIPALIALTSIVIIISSFTITSLLDGLALRRTDTRLLAAQWYHDNIPVGKTVIRERYTLGVKKEGVYEERGRHIPANYTDFDYAITSTKSYKRFYEKNSPYYDKDIQQTYNSLDKNWNKIKIFSDRELYFAHPTITVYQKP